MDLAAVELVANPDSHPLCPHLLGYEHSRIASVKSVLLYINMYLVAKVGFFGSIINFQDFILVLEKT